MPSSLPSNPWTITSTAASDRFTKEKYRNLLVRFLVETNSPFRLVEHQSFRRLMQYLNKMAPGLSRITITRDLLDLYKEMEPRVMEMLKQATSTGAKIHLTLDAWSSGNNLPFLGITGHWMDTEFEHRRITLDFCHLTGSHNAENMATTVLETLQKYNLEEHIGAVTCDNAKVNDKMVRELQNLLPEWKHADFHVRCLAHVINIVVQKIITSLKAEVVEMESQMVDEEIWEVPVVPGNTIRKVRRVVAKIRASHVLREVMQRECNAIKLKYLEPIIDVKTRYVCLQILS